MSPDRQEELSSEAGMLQSLLEFKKNATISDFHPLVQRTQFTTN